VQGAAIWIGVGIGIVQEACPAMVLLQRVQAATDWIQIRGHWVKLQHFIQSYHKALLSFLVFLLRFESPKATCNTAQKHATHKVFAYFYYAFGFGIWYLLSAFSLFFRF